MPIGLNPFVLGISLAVGLVIAVGAFLYERSQENREQDYRNDSNYYGSRYETPNSERQERFRGCTFCNDPLEFVELLSCQSCDRIYHERCANMMLERIFEEYRCECGSYI